MKPKKLLENIYYAAKHHQERSGMIKDDLLRDDLERCKARGSYDAYAHIVQMITHNDTIGIADYKKVFKMEETFPKKLY